jgi:hypothetical protein
LILHSCHATYNHSDHLHTQPLLLWHKHSPHTRHTHLVTPHTRTRCSPTRAPPTT